MVSIGAADTPKRGQRTSVGSFLAASKERPDCATSFRNSRTEEAIEGGESPKSWMRTWNYMSLAHNVEVSSLVVRWVLPTG